jgi:O-antigen/teichoic acid export membrane protein
MFLWIFSVDFVTIWTGKQVLAEHTAPIIALLSLGSAIHGLMHFPYALQLSRGFARLPLLINSILTLIYIPSIYVLAILYGTIGGASAWLFLNLLYLVIGTWLTHKMLRTDFTGKWLAFDIGHPVLISLVSYLVCLEIAKSSALTPTFNLLLGIAVTLVTISLILFTSANSRTFIRKALVKQFGA